MTFGCCLPGTHCTNRARRISKMNAQKNWLEALSSPATTTAPTELMPLSGTNHQETSSLWWMARKQPLWNTTGETALFMSTSELNRKVFLCVHIVIVEIRAKLYILWGFWFCFYCHCIVWLSIFEQQELWHYNQRDGPTTAHASTKGEVQARREGKTNIV